ncbi:hypothetical protein [Virgibacillus sp. YIM 98842]|uniref:hypothetical protein n=1 Tax=Virgibacillus sp. YIM 98842 TaxID=2663533 RepID=UPI0013DA0C3A|nr:hypothetical protein [Virgibacillus sp. YIM 98842]
MLKSKIVLSLFILFLLAGCNVLGQKDIAEMDPAELPDVIAFQDDFTREFMSSLEEVEDGYYLFESKTGGYTMMYPQNAKMDQGYFEMQGANYEAISFGENEETNNYVYFLRATYDEGERANESERLLRLLSTHAGYEGDYKSMKYDNKTIHYATLEDIDGSGQSDEHLLLAVIMSNGSDQAVSVRYNVIFGKGRSTDLETAQNESMKIMESIEFK